MSASLMFPVGGAARPAFADDEGGGGGATSAYVDNSGRPTAEARVNGRRTAARAGSGAQANCTWTVVNANDSEVAMYDVDGTRLRSETGRWLGRSCGGEPVRINDAFAAPERIRTVDPGTLARQARQSVAIPPPPMATSPKADQGLYVRVRTWLWLDPGWWRNYAATADAGGITTTVVARPLRAVWAMGDGGRTVCDGPGTEWRRGMADDGTRCSYVYTNSSSVAPAGVYSMAVTVEFAVTWSSSVGTAGSLAPITRSATRVVDVGEIQAIETQ